MSGEMITPTINDGQGNSTLEDTSDQHPPNFLFVSNEDDAEGESNGGNHFQVSVQSSDFLIDLNDAEVKLEPSENVCDIFETPEDVRETEGNSAEQVDYTNVLRAEMKHDVEEGDENGDPTSAGEIVQLYSVIVAEQEIDAVEGQKTKTEPEESQRTCDLECSVTSEDTSSAKLPTTTPQSFSLSELILNNKPCAATSKSKITHDERMLQCHVLLTRLAPETVGYYASNRKKNKLLHKVQRLAKLGVRKSPKGNDSGTGRGRGKKGEKGKKPRLGRPPKSLCTERTTISPASNDSGKKKENGKQSKVGRPPKSSCTKHMISPASKDNGTGRGCGKKEGKGKQSKVGRPPKSLCTERATLSPASNDSGTGRGCGKKEEKGKQPRRVGRPAKSSCTKRTISPAINDSGTGRGCLEKGKKPRLVRPPKSLCTERATLSPASNDSGNGRGGGKKEEKGKQSKVGRPAKSPCTKHMISPASNDSGTGRGHGKKEENGKQRRVGRPAKSSCTKRETFLADLLRGKKVTTKQEKGRPAVKSKKKKSEFWCNVCERTFYDSAPFKRHKCFNTVKTKGRFKCGKCGQAYGRREALEMHHRIMHIKTKIKYQCEFCLRFSTNSGNLASHRKICKLRPKDNVDEKNFFCSICQKPFLSMKGVIKHMGSYDCGLKYKCDLCCKMFKRFIHLKLHLNNHLSKEGAIICPERGCGLKMNDLTEYRVHLRIKHAAPPWPCPQCKKDFSEFGNMSRHMKIHLNIKDFECLKCGAVFTDQNSLVAHVRHNHTKEKPYKCETCAKAFAMKSDLIRHNRQHTGERNYECPNCCKAFRSRTDLIYHMRREAGEKHWQCGECNKQFFAKASLESHMITHTNIRQFVCDLCGKTFGYAACLKAHIRSHTGSQPFGCRICRKKFSHPSNRRRHEKTVHVGFEVDL